VRNGERGDSLIEAVVATAVIAVALGALACALLTATRRFGADPVQSALEASAAREMRVAVDVLKYRGTNVPATTLATTIPLPSASPFPAHLTLATTTASDGSVTIVLTAASDADATKRATLATTILAPAPQPGARIPASAGAAAPQ